MRESIIYSLIVSGLHGMRRFHLPGTLPMAGLIVAAALPCAAQLQQARTIILIGPPGSGKTAQSEFLRKRFKIPAISMAQLMKEEMDRGSHKGQLIAASLSSEELLSDESANELMKVRLLRPDSGRGFILDGYPVSEGQAKALDAWLLGHNLPKPSVIILDVPDDVSRSRLLKRHRADDTKENIERRLREYKEVGRLVERWYGAKQTARVDGSGPVAEVAKRVATALENVGEQQHEFKTREPEKEGFKQRPPQP